jgi:hypothetical protein
MQIEEQIKEQIKKKVGNQVWDQVLHPVWCRIWLPSNDKVTAYVSSRLTQLNQQLSRQAWSQAADYTYAQAREDIDAEAHRD